MTGTPAGAGAYQVWRRPLVRRRPLSVMNGSGYVVYVVVIVVGVYGSMVWRYLTSLGLGGAGRWPMGRVVVLAVGVLAVLGVLAARNGAPLWVSRRETVFALSGQFAPRVVLRGRASMLLVSTALVGALAGAAAAAGGGTGAATATWAVVAAALASVPVAVGAVAQVRRRRLVADVLAGAVLLAGVAVAAVPRLAVPAGVPVMVVALAAAVVAWWVVLRTVPSRLDVDDVAARGAGSVGVGLGMAAGDLQAAGRAIPVRYRGPRRLLGSGAWAWLTRTLPVVARDLVGQRRRPFATLAGLVAGAAGSWLVLTSTSAAVVALAALLLYAALGATGLGLTAFFRQPVPGGLLPGSGPRGLARHLAVPGVATVVMVVLGRAVADVLGQQPAGHAYASVAVVAAVALAARAWAAGGSTVPPALYTPMVTPLGDLSIAVVGMYFVRAWLVLAGIAWLVASAGVARVWLLPTVATVFFVLRARHRASR